VPDAPRILGDLRAWSGGGPRPAWMCPPAPAQPDGRLRTRVAATFAGMLRIEHLGRPREASAGGTLDLDFEAQLDRFDASEFDDLDFYIHLRGADGARAWDGGVPVAEALARHEAGFDVRLPIAADLRPGLYDMYVGVYNRATRHQLKASVDAAGAVRLRGRSAFAGPLRVRPAEPAAANAGQ
jgi:hypothetical protein